MDAYVCEKGAADMSLTIELSPEIEARVREYATKIGKPAEEVGQIAMFRFIHSPDRVPMPWELTDEEKLQKEEAYKALTAIWEADAKRYAEMTSEERAESQREADELTDNLNRNRVEADERPLFPVRNVS
jgi:hypothetical protein